MLKELKIDKKNRDLGYLYICDTYYDKINDHLKTMNTWRDDPELKKIFTKEFTLFDALHDLLMKGLL